MEVFRSEPIRLFAIEERLDLKKKEEIYKIPERNPRNNHINKNLPSGAVVGNEHLLRRALEILRREPDWGRSHDRSHRYRFLLLCGGRSHCRCLLLVTRRTFPIGLPARLPSRRLGLCLFGVGVVGSGPCGVVGHLGDGLAQLQFLVGDVTGGDGAHGRRGGVVSLQCVKNKRLVVTMTLWEKSFVC